jgi:hypothetical protein
MNYIIPYSPTENNNNNQRINKNNNNKINGTRKILKGYNNNSLSRINNDFITHTIKTNVQFDIFIKNLLKKSFKYPQSDEKWISKTNKIFENYTINKKTNVINTIKTIYNKLAILCYVQIRDNKIKMYCNFANIEFKNNWFHKKNIIIPNNYKKIREDNLKRTNLNEYKLKEELNYEENFNKWTANGCLIGTLKNPVYRGFNRLRVFFKMISLALENTENVNCDFIINRRDFPIVKTNNTHPYDFNNDLFYNNKEESYYPIPILSLSTGENYADIPIPTRDDWTLATNNNEIKDNYLWNDKIKKAVWRGNATNCGTTENDNQRIYLHQLNKKINDYIDAGLVGWNSRDKFNKNTKKIEMIDISHLDPLKKRLSYEQQLKYKYHLNLDGHVPAFRLGQLLAFNIVILQVDSPKKWKLWYQNKLIPYDIYDDTNSNNINSHYIPIKKDMSNLKETIIWCRNNDDICFHISQRATNFFNNNLKKEHLIKYIEELIKKI